ncbi:MAG: Xaa-Pro peptidase family protein [Candidatus Aenigmatarchaeota archaeon]
MVDSIMKAIGNENLHKLRREMEEKNVQASLFVNFGPVVDPNIRYFSGFVDEQGGTEALLITGKSKIFFTSSLDLERAKEQADVNEVVDVSKDGFSKTLLKYISKSKKIGINKSSFPLVFYERLKLKFIDIEDVTDEIRSVKTNDEISLLETSARISNSGIKVAIETLQEISRGRKISEFQLAKYVEEAMAMSGSEDLSFKTISVANERGAFPHPYPPISNKLIEKGIGYIDFGAVYQGYHSDVTLPFIIGKISEKQKEIIQTVVDAYDISLASVKEKVPTWKLQDKAEKFLKSKGFKFIHSLGHGLGLTVHDSPSISSKPKDKERLKTWKEIKLKENMVVTIEPGVYVKGVGGCRLENDMIVKKNAPKVLTNSRLIEI